AREHEVRHVRAGDQQYERNGAEEHEHRPAQIAGEVLAHRLELRRPSRVLLWKLVLQLPRDTLEIRLRGCEGNAGLQTPDRARISAVVTPLGGKNAIVG